MNTNLPIVIVGGGAAGFFAAVNAARLGAKVILLEKTGKLLSKVKVSGGGRCNVTHACFSIPEMAARYPRGGAFLKKAFRHFFTTDCITWWKERGVELKTEADGRMFPVTDSSQTIMDCLLREASRYGVEIKMNRELLAIHPRSGFFDLEIRGGENLSAAKLLIASGGFPKPAQFNWLQALGHSIEPPVPSLFTFNMPGNPITALMGVSVPMARVKLAGQKMEAEGPLLITHWGMSGPAILRLSARGARLLAEMDYSFTVLVNWVPDYREDQLRTYLLQYRQEQGALRMANRSPMALPQRLWEYLLQASGIGATTRWADLPAKEQNRLISNLSAMECRVAGKTTFKEEFVTCGGIRLTEISPDTMESKLVPGLYFAGEVMDVDGITGGFNFQHAWTSGWIAARAMAGQGKNPD